MTAINVNELLSQLTDEQKQLLKDTINFGFWGDTDMEFVNNEGEVETFGSDGYCTNDAKKAGHFNGRKISAMFRSIYKKLCVVDGMGTFLTHCSDWWGKGTGDMLFIKSEFSDAFEKWAREK